MGRLEIPMAQGSSLKLYEAMWGPIYEAVLNILGTTGTILPIGDPKHGLPDAAAFKTVGGEQVDFTWGTDTSWAAFDGHDALADSDTHPYRYEGIIPIIDFNGTDEEADSPDIAYWSRALAVFSVGAWVNFRDATSSIILSKYDSGGNTREWFFGTTGADTVQIFLADESESGNPNINTLANTAAVQDVWQLWVATSDGSADATGLNLYLNGSLAASTDNDDAGFVSTEDLGGTMTLAHQNATPANLFDGLMAGGPCGPFFTQKELTADEVLRLYELGRRALAL